MDRCKFRQLCVAFWGLLGLTALPLHADITNQTARPHISAPYAQVTPAMTADPADKAWDHAAVIPALPLMLSEEKDEDPALPTEVRLLWDERYLYVRFNCTGTEIYAPVSGHDAPYYTGDVSEVFLDPKGDARQVIELEVGANNGVMDQMILCTAEHVVSTPSLRLTDQITNCDLWFNLAWNLDGLRTATHVTKDGEKVTGWVTDMAIPANGELQRLGVDKFTSMRLRINFLRYDHPLDPKQPGTRKFIAMNWAPTVNGCPHLSPTALGVLTLVDDRK